MQLLLCQQQDLLLLKLNLYKGEYMNTNEYGLYQSPCTASGEVPCKSCNSQVHPDKATWYNVGISHYSKEKGVSYIQDHGSTFTCNEVCAKDNVHASIDKHTSLKHGVYTDTLNPDQSHASELVRQNAEYSPITRTWESLPTVDAITGENLGNDIYIPHLDRWSHSGGVQGGYHQFTGELATATLEDCIELCHRLIDKVLSA